MKKKAAIVTIIMMTVLFVIGSVVYAQMYYTASSLAAVENNGKEWIEKRLPPAIIMFSDNSGEAELKADISPLLVHLNVMPSGAQNTGPSYVDFTMDLDKKQIAEELYTGKIFTTAGFLRINDTRIKVSAQYTLEPLGDIENGFTISLIIRLNPDDFKIKIDGEPANAPLLLKVTSGIVNQI